MSRLNVSLMLGGLAAIGWTAWLVSSQEQMVLTIKASREPELAQPVYDTHVFTQVVTLTRPTRLSGVQIPLSVPTADQPLRITLRQEGRLIYEWDYRSRETGFVDARFTLPPLLWQGSIDIEINGQTIKPRQKDEAPRVFIESDDAAYPEGNYRIANNHKSGDMALTLFETKRRGALFVERWREWPLAQASRAGHALLLTMLVCVVPYTLTASTKAGI